LWGKIHQEDNRICEEAGGGEVYPVPFHLGLWESEMKVTNQLRELIGGKDIVIAPGAFDAISTKLIKAAGFEAVYMTGFGTAACIFGFPDIGLLTLTEMVENANRISDAVKAPVIANADTGYGNHLNVIRTVKEFEKAGVAAIHIEDQILPKKCGHMGGIH
jgi:2-methylisocitrate lyase-like PEP mutase family enzyme